jgi:hypothetical protein
MLPDAGAGVLSDLAPGKLQWQLHQDRRRTGPRAETLLPGNSVSHGAPVKANMTG